MASNYQQKNISRGCRKEPQTTNRRKLIQDAGSSLRLPTEGYQSRVPVGASNYQQKNISPGCRKVSVQGAGRGLKLSTEAYQCREPVVASNYQQKKTVQGASNGLKLPTEEYQFRAQVMASNYQQKDIILADPRIPGQCATTRPTCGDSALAPSYPEVEEWIPDTDEEWAATNEEDDPEPNHQERSRFTSWTEPGRVHTGGSSSCFQLHVWKHCSTPSRLRLSSCRSFGASLYVLHSGLMSGALVDKGNEGCRYVTTHNSTDCCRANHEASLVTQIIRPTCSWIEHNNCDTQPVSSAITSRVASSVGFPLLCYEHGLQARTRDVRKETGKET
ncbi:hypothetical protein PoB_006214200 [Plakobranchus ocellatus]|uniref:Uncharacterized protein n=1 Tax=Plakobranchus ocellatus TaxID=259542 RepID=A0AAV4CUP4_9GAST|nr:hypothetical protein PoB_006214200 [Plakobranchus ocellatus]